MFKKLKRRFWMADAIQTVKRLRAAYHAIRDGYETGEFPANRRAEQNIATYILDAEHHLKQLRKKLLKPVDDERYLINKSTLMFNGVLKTVTHANGISKTQSIRRLMSS